MSPDQSELELNFLEVKKKKKNEKCYDCGTREKKKNNNSYYYLFNILYFFYLKLLMQFHKERCQIFKNHKQKIRKNVYVNSPKNEKYSTLPPDPPRVNLQSKQQ